MPGLCVAFAGSNSDVKSLPLSWLLMTHTSSPRSLTGPDGVWFGVGFFAQSMRDAPYALVVDGRGLLAERLIN